jgi:histidyl-tRNA synthetase
MSKPSIPRGTRDFTPKEMRRRNYIFAVIRETFHRYGFEQIETPAMENLTTLEGKYGEEGDKLLFRILNSGDVVNTAIAAGSGLKTSDLAEKGLRYDLTVPFARYVVMHQNDISFPFRRYQIQPVWRADRPQKGRYREFYQCDADVIGSDSLFNEADLLSIITDVFRRFDIAITIKLNNRKILAGIAENIGAPDKIVDLTVAIDKLEKIGYEKVVEELANRGFTAEAISKLQPIIRMEGDNNNKLSALKTICGGSETGMKGIAETEEILGKCQTIDETIPIEVDITLARGLNYYTGAIIEVKCSDRRSTFTSSICGGGRYDDLTGVFGLKGMSGVGISFGADRIYDVLEEMEGFPGLAADSTQLLFVNFGAEEAVHCLKLATSLRAQGINTEVYPDQAKIRKQMSYADSKKIPFVALIGSDEMRKNTVAVKRMSDGQQFECSGSELFSKMEEQDNFS